MKKTIHRDLVFTAAEVKSAILAMLRAEDHPYPGLGVVDETFQLGEYGASLAWTEVVEN